MNDIDTTATALRSTSGSTPAARRPSAFKRTVSALAATAVLAVGGFGALSTTEAQAASVKASNYSVVQVAAENSQAATVSGDKRQD